MISVSVFTMAMLQLDTQDEKKANLKQISEMIDEAASKRAQFVCLPEMANYIGIGDGPFINAEDVPGGETSALYAEKAKKYGIWIHGGSITEKIPGDKHVYNTTVVVNPKGEFVAKYRKIHLYDIDVKDGVSFKESDSIKAGDEIVTFNSDFGPMGLAICYDIRFPELFRLLTLRGAKLIFNPAEFNLFTGKDHWENLVRARAIENVCYMVAPGQFGPKKTFHTYGRSIVVDPWGNVIAKASDRACVVTAEIDMGYVDTMRAQLPCIKNRRPDTYKW
ncbi:MAG TPA: hydrolase [Synergistaceae bacterium]|nr:hydrolase [Synergistaceae bacterium]